MRIIIIIFSFFTLSFVNTLSLKDKIVKGQIGDYTVTEQGKMYTVLLIRDIQDSRLILEEISVPEAEIDLKQTTWKQWIESKAPGNTSWTGYKIDLKSNELLEGYSYSRKAYLYKGDPNHFLAKLLALNLKPTPEDKRQRIGPPPSVEEIDHRAFWNPSVMFEGKQIKKPSLTSWIGRWPNDKSILSNCEIELYFSDFPFPYWIDMKSPHYRVSISTVDSGHHLHSPMPPMPQGPPEFIGRASWKSKKIELKLKCPSPDQILNLCIFDLSSDSEALLLLKPFKPAKKIASL